MISPGERIALPWWRAGIRTRAVLALDALRAEVSVGSVDLARIGLASLALALGTLVLRSPGHFRPAPIGPFPLLVSLGTLGMLALSLLATLDLRALLPVKARQALAATALLVLSVLSVVGATQAVNGIWLISRTTPYTNDGAVMDLYAATRVLHGHDPYIKTNIVVALAAINAPATTTTPLAAGQFRGARAYPSEAAVEQAFLSDLRYRARQGVPVPAEFESKYNYPAGSFLFILPFVWAGMNDMRFLFTVAVMLMGLYLWTRVGRPLRFLVPLLLLSNVPLVILTAGGQPDPIYGILLMIGYAEWASPWLSPLAMGLSASTKQLAWFFMPFYLLLVWRRLGAREAARRSAIMAAVFLVTNGPFIVQSPSGYLASVSGPMSDPMFPLGIGVIALFVSGLLPMAPKIAFTVVEAASWLLSVGSFLRSRYLTPASGVVLGALPLFFAWRSLVNYFYLVPLLALAAVLADARQRERQRREA